MEMDVEYGLAGLGIAVVYDPEAPLAKAPFPGNPGRHREKVAQKFLISLSGIEERGDMLPGDDQRMKGCLRIDVFKSQAPVILENDPGGDFFRDDFTEKAVLHGLLPGLVRPPSLLF
jgi:hypothetical protein